MSEYVFLYRGDRSRMAPEEMQKSLQRWAAWMKQLGERGHLKDPGHPLDGAGKVVRARGGNVTDGPLVEKDIVLGFTIVSARDVDEAATLAEGCPIIDGGGSVEVRPIMKM
jgi:hypothetical protein